MMRRKENFRKIFLVLFCFLSLILSFGLVKTAHAATNEFNDGITWDESPSTVNKVGEIPISNTLSLGYAFGLAQDSNGKVTTGGDSYVDAPSTGSGVNTYYSKINIFLNDNGNYKSSVYQSYATSTQPMFASQGVSSTSPDFMIVPNANSGAIKGADYSILVNSLKNKQYYIGKDSNGNPAYRIVGDFVRNDSTTGNFNLRAEIVLRRSPSGAPIVQRELYLKNNQSTSQSYGVLYGEDTKLSKNDSVVLKNLGGGKGLYMVDGGYQLVVSNNIKDGPTAYQAQYFTNTNSNWLTRFSPENFSGTGAEDPSNVYGSNIYNSPDSAYTVKWPYTTIKPGETKHYSTAMGVTEATYAVPDAEKTFTNETSSNGKNNVGDKLKFNLKITNNGSDSKWNYKELTDKIPAGLKVDLNSVKLTTPTGGTVSVTPGYSDSVLSVPTNTTLTDGQSATITYEAVITPDASGQTLTNVGTFTGKDLNNTNSNDKSYTASVDIPVEKSPFSYTFTNYLRNESEGETTYSSQTKAKAGDIIDYEIRFTVTSDESFVGGTMKNPLPDGLEFVKATIHGSDGWSGSTTLDGGINIGGISKGTSVLLEIQAKVTKTNVGTISSNAVMTGTTSTGASTGDIVSNQADINISNVVGFTQTPTLIDFGSINFTGQARTLTNVATTGQLIANHPTDNNYSVSVAYNNDDSATQMKNGNGDTLSPSADGLMFIRTRNSSPDDKGTWTPISPSGTPIQTGTFNGNQDLTNYIGVGDWKLNIASDTQPGKYTGTLTWSMADSIPNN
ncbi:isopeptide-forming domain-containing fimbrial protein [Companilactobacillus sp. HBUAS59699]|uniref:isopeptide-forming domain-containing fimbrial protein n=1 Tax=Companilactobacillus sp. HBUAS59699 TaxID=3109358 RepID=UPI002FF19635